VVLVDPGRGPGPLVDSISAALGSGRYARSAAVASARRVLSLKRTTNAPLATTSLAPASGTTGASLTPTFSGLARDRVGGPLKLQLAVRTAGSTTWDVANTSAPAVASGTRGSYRLPAGRLRPGTTYEWVVRTCNGAGLCGPSSPVLRFTTG
ncbi:MAG: hypothetical protein JWN84_920, partial [Nocardioides sp.]|nr:hypothetical protein [Nocardioides sp.]